MRAAIRPLLSVIVILLAVSFVLQNAWMTAENSVSYRLFTYDFGSSPGFPIWGLVLGAFFIGYVLGWSVGRLDIMSLQGQVRKLKRRVAEFEASKVAPVGYNPVPDAASKESTK